VPIWPYQFFNALQSDRRSDPNTMLSTNTHTHCHQDRLFCRFCHLPLCDNTTSLRALISRSRHSPFSLSSFSAFSRRSVVRAHWYFKGTGTSGDAIDWYSHIQSTICYTKLECIFFGFIFPQFVGQNRKKIHIILAIIKQPVFNRNINIKQSHINTVTTDIS